MDLPPERNMLGVVVVIPGEDPQQFENWKSALDAVAMYAQGDDPVLVSIHTLYWSE
jgi:hypothetical protein